MKGISRGFVLSIFMLIMMIGYMKICSIIFSSDFIVDLLAAGAVFLFVFFSTLLFFDNKR